jgi:hypothetical protein
MSFRSIRSIRSYLSWILRGPARLERVEHSVDELRIQLAELNLKQDASLADIRNSVLAVLDDVDQRMTGRDQRSR